MYWLSHFSQDSAAKDAHENASITQEAKTITEETKDSDQAVSVSLILPTAAEATPSEGRNKNKITTVVPANEMNVTVTPITSQSRVPEVSRVYT